MTKRKKWILIAVIAAILLVVAAVLLNYFLFSYNPKEAEMKRYFRKLRKDRYTGYVLAADNESVGVKLYTYMVNGVGSDDFYMEFYDAEGNLTKVTKSDHAMTEEDVAAVAAQVDQYDEEHRFQFGVELTIRYVKGVWMLAEVERIYDSCGACILDTVYYNALTGEVIEE